MTETEHFDVGDVAVLTATFTTPANAPATPDAVTGTFTRPDKTTGTLVVTPTPGSPGVYTAPLDLTAPGVWSWRIAGTGAAKAAETGRLYAHP